MASKKLSTRRKPSIFHLPFMKRSSVTGTVLVCGSGDFGQLGLGPTHTKCKQPVHLDGLRNVVDICAGGLHSLLLVSDGRVYSFGCNRNGALGRDTEDTDCDFVPGVVTLPSKAVKISAGGIHSSCLLENGQVYTWGTFYDACTNHLFNKYPVDVLPGKVCRDIASGAGHLVILTCDGKVYTLGCSEQGQLGRVTLRCALGAGHPGQTLLQPCEVFITSDKPVEAIWAFKNCTFLRESETNYIWACGLNNFAQLGTKTEEPNVYLPINTKIQNVKQIAGGLHHTLFLKNEGTCVVVGRHDCGRLGLGCIDKDIVSPQQITALAKKSVADIFCGEEQSFAVTKDGKLYSWGMGFDYQLGTGSYDDVLEPMAVQTSQIRDKVVGRVSCGLNHTLFLVTTKRIISEPKKPMPRIATTKILRRETVPRSKLLPVVNKPSETLEPAAKQERKSCKATA